LAVSTNLWTLAIDPTSSGSTDKLLQFLWDVVFTEFCNTNRNHCLNSISTYLKREILPTEPWTTITESELKKIIQQHISTKMQEPITSIDIQSGLDEKTIDTISKWNNEALFFVSNHLYVNPTKIHNKEILRAELHTLLGIDEKRLDEKFAIRKKRRMEIIRKMSLSTRDMVNARIASEKLAIKEGKMDPSEAIYPFLIIEDNLLRNYPEGNTASQITGFVDAEGKWRYGIEWYFESDLQKENPIQTVIKDTAGRPIRDYVSENSLTMKNGIDITLTIDRNIQKEISKILKRAIEKYRANKGSVIVMNPKSGAIIAMVNYPDFDANDFTDVYDMELVSYAKYPKPGFDLLGYPLFVVDSLSGTLVANIEWKRLKLREALTDEIENFAIMKYKFKNWFWVGNYKNDVIGSLYEPGSVFKAFTVAIGIDTGEIKPSDTYFDRGYVELDVWATKPLRISNADKRCIGRHTFIHSLDWSCNVGMIQIVEKVGKSLFHQYLLDFWFNNKTNLTTDGEVYAQIPPYEKWPRVQFFNMSFWQGISVTMLQMATAYSALANGGVYMQPYIVESMTYPDGKKIETLPTPLRRVIKESTSKQITAMLVNGVKYGFAKDGSVPGYTIAGKTGTSQIPSKWWYEPNGPSHTITSFWGYAPANNPKFVVIVRVDRPRISEWSEYTSSPLFAEVTKYLLEYYKVPKNPQ
jgi:stage V sporulation protein D (sporulation-specific penicillin-binding protein)